MPKKILVEVCNLCNLSCEMCFLSGFRRKNIVGAKDFDVFLPLDIFKKLVDEISADFHDFQKNTPFSLIISGGEPFLHPKIFEMLAYAKDNDLRATVFTNGTLIDFQLALKIVQAAPEALMFSIDGTQNIHDKIRGEGNFQKTCDAIKFIQEQKYILNLRKPRIFINTIINNLNIEQLEELIFLSEELKVSNIAFSHIQWSTPDISNSVLNEFKTRLQWSAPESRLIEAMEHNLSVKPENLIRLMDKIDSIKINHKRGQHQFDVNFLPDLLKEEIAEWYSGGIYKINFCDSPGNWIRVGSNGDIRPVCALILFPFGNLSTQSLKEILAGQRTQKFFEEIKNNGYFYACQRCDRRPDDSIILR